MRRVDESSPTGLADVAPALTFLSARSGLPHCMGNEARAKPRLDWSFLDRIYCICRRAVTTGPRARGRSCIVSASAAG
jgi:hypothetical protein